MPVVSAQRLLFEKPLLYRTCGLASQGHLKVVRKPGVKGGSSSWQGNPYLLNPLHDLEPDIAKGVVACGMQVPAASHGKGKTGAPFSTRAVPV